MNSLPLLIIYIISKFLYVYIRIRRDTNFEYFIHLNLM